jgi:hypothetical protein
MSYERAEGQGEVDIYTMPALFMLKAEIPEKLVDGLNDYLDELREDEDRESLAKTLVGQIHQGEQLNIPPTDDERIQPYVAYLCDLGATYINHFSQSTGIMFKHNKQIALDELWSVHSFEGDYNPIHDHGTKTIMGISTTTWTKVPQQILDQPTSGTPEYSLYNSSGHSDGCLAFSYGRNSLIDTDRLFPPQSAVVKPEIGVQYMFPSGLQHMVYPFFGEGERRTVAANLNCWDVQEKQ